MATSDIIEEWAKSHGLHFPFPDPEDSQHALAVSGMDPYIESFGLWEDFHSKLIGEMERSLSSLVPDRYVVRTGERAYVAIGGPSGDEGHEFLPDLALASTRGPEAGGPTAAATPEAGGARGGPGADAGPVPSGIP